jgi:predicted RNase H-like HicB family nuclease
MQEITFLIEDDLEDGGFIAEAQLPNNEQIVTQGNTIDELKTMIKEAIICHFETVDMPHKVIMKYIRQEEFAF